jgi:hypothetical protein
MTRKFTISYELSAHLDYIPPEYTVDNGRITVRAFMKHNQARELDVLVVEFEGSGSGIVNAIAESADAFGREVAPELGLVRPTFGPGNLDVWRALAQRGWDFTIKVLDTPYVKGYK